MNLLCRSEKPIFQRKVNLFKLFLTTVKNRPQKRLKTKGTHFGSIFSSSVTILYTLLADSQFFEHFCRRAVVLLVLNRPNARLFRPFQYQNRNLIRSTLKRLKTFFGHPFWMVWKVTWYSPCARHASTAAVFQRRAKSAPKSFWKRK